MALLPKSPIKIKISAKPITIEQKRRFNFGKENWDKYQEIITNKIQISDLNNINKETIDTEIKRWMKTITNAAKEAIPIRKMDYLIHPPDNDFLKVLVDMYNQLKNFDHWNRYQLYLIRNIQKQIKQENLRLYNETWSSKIIKIQDIYIMIR